MPYPTFSSEQSDQLVSLVRQVGLGKCEFPWQAIASGDPAKALRELEDIIDGLVLDAYGISTEGRNELRTLFTGHVRPGSEWKGILEERREVEEESRGPRAWTVTGQVLEVLNSGDDVSLALWQRDHYRDEPILSQAPEDMPGCAIRTDVAFEATVPWDMRNEDQLAIDTLRDFRPVGYSFASTADLVRHITGSGRVVGAF